MSYTASQVRPLKSWLYLRDLTLADRNPASQEPIHFLSGADLYRSLLRFSSGSVGHTHGSKNRTWLNHI